MRAVLQLVFPIYKNTVFAFLQLTPAGELSSRGVSKKHTYKFQPAPRSYCKYHTATSVLSGGCSSGCCGHQDFTGCLIYSGIFKLARLHYSKYQITASAITPWLFWVMCCVCVCVCGWVWWRGRCTLPNKTIIITRKLISVFFCFCFLLWNVITETWN